MDKKVKLFGLVSIVALLVVFGLLAIPQFIVSIKTGAEHPVYIMGYQFFFKAYSDVFSKGHSISGVSGVGITAIVLMVLALASFLFARKSSAFLMLGGILNVVASVMFFVMVASKNKVFGVDRELVSVLWVTYVCGALLVLTGLISIYIAFKSMRQERKVIATSKSYSYLKK